MTQPRLLGGRYELDGIVGRGGMAEVFRARDIRLDRIVGVKTLRDDLARDQTFQARFRREAQSAASLNHPSIVAVYDTGEDMVNGTPVPYIVMEFVDGRTLRDLLRDDRRLLPERAAEITDGVLRALDYSHRNGIVHRDIKPGNVMLTRTGDIKVMDFGIARAVSDAQATMTQTAQVIGTAQYLSPEQARGERVDARSDLYSAGCLLYELLTGRPPFTGDSPVAIAYQHVREDPIPPSQVDPDVPPWADAIVLKAMMKDPADRYQSAGDMRNDLQRALSGAPVAAPMRTEMYAGGTRRMGQATQVAGATSAIPPYAYGQENDGSDYGERPPRKAWPWVLAAAIVLILLAGGIYAFNFASGNGGSIAVPAVDNLTVTAAQKQIVSAGLVAGKVTFRTSSTVAANHVISTNPTNGTTVKAHATVSLLVSKGTGSKTVPPVVGQPVSAAEDAILKAGLKFKEKFVTSAHTPGDVVFQSPAAGDKEPAGTVVRIDVSKGGQKVPNVIGQSQADATAELEGLGFQVHAVTETAPSGFTAGAVFSTSPAQGKVAARGSFITIAIAAGPTATPTTSAPATTPPTSPPASPPTSPPPTSPGT
jgi:beta-lactam-binding protein with PASTA domain/tRNA A-37 threonylcarbamoyl transferase component Bud32